MATKEELEKEFFRMSQEQQREELIKCKNDPAYFIGKYAKIRHPIKGLVDFHLWDFQREILYDFMNYRNNLYVKSRQLGLSTLVACYAVWFAFFHKHKSVLILAIKRDVASNLLKKVKLAYYELPEFLQRIHPISGDGDNASTLRLTNGSEIKCESTTTKAVRSEALSLLILDEAAFIDEAEQIWRSAKPALDSGGSCIAISSPNGEGNWFHNQYLSGKDGTGTFHVRELMWDLRPDRDEAWLEETKKSFLKEEDFEQEYCCSFLASGRTVLPPYVLKSLRSKVVLPARQFYGGYLYIWEEYQKRKMYFATIDVSRGDGEDYSTMNVWKCEEKVVQVAEYQGKIKTTEFGKIIYDIGKEYGYCLLVVENNSYGIAVLNELVRLKYPHLYYSYKDSKEKVVYNPYKNYSNDSNYRIGIYTSANTREYFMVKMEEAILREKVIIRSSRLVDELYTFIWKNGKRTATKGHNDDLVLTLAFASWFWLDILEEKYEYSDSFAKYDLSNLFSVSSKKMPNTDVQYLHNQFLDGKIDASSLSALIKAVFMNKN
ncbi:MAG: terminase family protein [Patescibacteria group bacterium]|nr:terminase family protein [Patescibacteria group bacterium]